MEIFRVDDRVTWSALTLATPFGQRHVAQYGSGPFEVHGVRNVTAAERPATLHSQMLFVKLADDEQVEFSGFHFTRV